MVSMTILPLLQRAQVCKPLCLLRLTYWGEVWKGWSQFPLVILFPPEQWRSDSNLTRRGRRTPSLRTGMKPKGAPDKLQKDSDSEWKHRVSLWAWGLRTKQAEREEESSDIIYPHPLPSLATRSSAYYLPPTWRLHRIYACSQTNYSCLWNPIVNSHGILSHLCCFVWTCMCLFLFILLDFKFSEGRMYVWTILFVIHPPPGKFNALHMVLKLKCLLNLYPKE